MNGHAAEVVQNLDSRKLGGVVYRPAVGSADFRLAQALLKDEGVLEHKLSSPTILAFKDAELIGLFGTQPRRDMIVAGPLVVRTGAPRRFTVLRLMETYDIVMRALGISTYTMFVGREDEGSLDLLHKMPGFEQIAENIDGVMFARRL